MSFPIILNFNEFIDLVSTKEIKLFSNGVAPIIDNTNKMPY